MSIDLSAGLEDEVKDAPPDPSQWKDKAKILVTRNRANGRLQRWQLKNGEPILVSEEKK